MPSRTDSASQLSAIRDEHRQLVSYLKKLAGAQSLAVLRATLDGLVGLVHRHFAREESAHGLHAIVAAQAPHLVGRAARMLHEHNTILDGLKALVASAQGHGVRLAGLRPAVAALVACMQAHEEAERELLSESMTVDLGAGG